MPQVLKSTRSKLRPGKTKLDTAKHALPYYLSTEHRQWRAAVMRRAHARCEAIEDGRRCERRYPGVRLFVDHVIELRDGGSPHDPANGMVLCGKHHTLKTTQARRVRLLEPRGGHLEK
jgi:5-methylcytosine-specific restriction endonuclease McrA